MRSWFRGETDHLCKAPAEDPRRARLDLPTLPSQCRLAMSGGSFVGGARVHSPQNIPVAIPRRQFVVITRLLGSGGLCTKAWKDGTIPSPHLVPLPEGEETLEQALGARRREQSLDRFTHRVGRLKGPLSFRERVGVRG